MRNWLSRLAYQHADKIKQSEERRRAELPAVTRAHARENLSEVRRQIRHATKTSSHPYINWIAGWNREKEYVDAYVSALQELLGPPFRVSISGPYGTSSGPTPYDPEYTGYRISIFWG